MSNPEKRFLFFSGLFLAIFFVGGFDELFKAYNF